MRLLRILILGSSKVDKQNESISKLSEKKQAEIMEMYHNQWLTKVPEVKYTPLHWLGYWNDYHSIDFLLCQVDKTKMEHVETIMQRTSKDLTPLDIAARNKSN